jgi:hypothetical protein
MQSKLLTIFHRAGGMMGEWLQIACLRNEVMIMCEKTFAIERLHKHTRHLSASHAAAAAAVYNQLSILPAPPPPEPVTLNFPTTMICDVYALACLCSMMMFAAITIQMGNFGNAATRISELSP